MKYNSHLVKYLTAVLEETHRIPQRLASSDLTIDTKYGVVYPSIRGLSKIEMREILTVAFPDYSSFEQTFHESWQKIAETPELKLWTDAVLHYFSTYGLESLGLNSPDRVYVPNKISKHPELSNFRIIGTIDENLLANQISQNLKSGLPLRQHTIKNYLTIINGLMLPLDTKYIKNKEVKTIIQCQANIVPDDGEECIRIINYLITGRTLLVQNDKTINEFWSAAFNLNAQKRYQIQYLLIQGREQCAKVFYRYKKLFLALKRTGFPMEINRIRRRAKKLWQPNPSVPYLSTQILDGTCDLSALEKLTNFDLAKIYNKINALIVASELDNYEYYDIVVIRNGSLYVNPQPKSITKTSLKRAQEAKKIILDLLKKRLNPKGNRQLALPQSLELAFPTSEKSFIGDMPLYSRAICPAASVIGVSWERDDLDLSALLGDQSKIGWNSNYKTKQKDILYSGDMTRGGSEALFFNANRPALIMINTYFGDIPEINLFISDEKEFNMSNPEAQSRDQSHYIYDPNNIIYSTKLSVNNWSSTIGVFEKKSDQTVFTFANLSFGRGRVSRGGELTSDALSALSLRGASSLKLNDIFPIASGKQDKDPIDLTNLNRATILDLVH